MDNKNVIFPIKVGHITIVHCEVDVIIENKTNQYTRILNVYASTNTFLRICRIHGHQSAIH